MWYVLFFLFVSFLIGYTIIKIFKFLRNIFSKNSNEVGLIDYPENIKKTPKQYSIVDNYKENKKHSNKSNSIKLSLNKITIEKDGFKVYFNTHNIDKKIVHFAVIEAYYVTNENEQIKSGFYDVLIMGDNSEIVTREILPNLNVLRNIYFKNDYKDFSTNDLMMINYYVNGTKFYLAEKLEFIKNKEIQITEEY
jgi:hypothetical protein